MPLSRRELEEKLEQLHPSVFFSHELCARYFTYMSRESGAHFVLFDDRDTLRKKLEVAQELGITSAVAALPEVLDAAGDCGGFILQWAWSTGIAAGRAAARGL